MDDQLQPIKTVKTVQNNIHKFENLSLNKNTMRESNGEKSKKSIVDITSANESDASDSVFDLRPSIASSKTSTTFNVSEKQHKRHDSTAFLNKVYLDKTPPTSLPDDALEIIKSQPNHEDLLAVLQYLEYGIEGKHNFNISTTGPKAAQIINAMVTVTISDHWHILNETKIPKRDMQLKKLLVLALRSIAGVGALLMHIRNLAVKGKDHATVLHDMISVLEQVLHGSGFLSYLLHNVRTLYTTETQKRVAWNETTSLLSGSKILSTVSQASSRLESAGQEATWLSKGGEYSRWLAKNIVHVVITLDSKDERSWAMVSQVMKRALSLGYRDEFVSEVYTALLLDSHAMWTPLQKLLTHLSPQEQRSFFDSVLRDLVQKYLHSTSEGLPHATHQNSHRAIAGVAALVLGLIQHNSVLEEHIAEWLTSTTGEYVNFGLDTRRTLIATLALQKEKLQEVLDRCLDSFGDKLQIQHNPMLQQEATTQVILLAIGCLARYDIEAVRQMSKSAPFMRSISNRLGASIPRARFLGMIMATAISRLADPGDKNIDFGVDELETEEAQRWLDLVHVKDEPGQLEDLVKHESVKLKAQPDDARSAPKQRLNVQKRSSQVQRSKIISIEEIEDDEEDTEDDLPSHLKPDDDPSDSDEDPTLLNRNKPSAPIYIIDLIKQLQADDKPDTVELALRTAPDLIRRKANFGSELSENVQVVAAALINLKEGMDGVDTQHLRQQALTACLVSKPAIIGPWIASMYFEGDFALAQRAAMLSTIGVGARELAGYHDEHNVQDSTSKFPSRHLPAHLATIYSPTENIAGEIERKTLQPLALAAADKLSGPDILKIRTFSSRMEVQKKQEKKHKERIKRIPRDLHQLLAESLYLPLCCRMSLICASNADLGRTNIFEPHIIRLFLQTLTIVFFCLGPNALQLFEVSRESLLLLTALHNIPKLACDPVVLPALLQLLLTTMDLNIEAGAVGEERLLTEFGPMLAELINWAGELEKVISVPVATVNDVPGMPWTVIVAGIQVKWHEIGRKYQGRMLGLTGGDLENF